MVLGNLCWVIQLELVTLQLLDYVWTGELDRIISRGPFQTQPVVLRSALGGSHGPSHPTQDGQEAQQDVHQESLLLTAPFTGNEKAPD